ncbi:hypothetical protein [uncultured Roseibium sp.]|uniref:hypothetical protein n=1 Tax=uncultured Roseibium sp. TaxID=1936171 RepID=UPI003216B6E3
MPAAGLLRFGQDINPDTFVLALPLDAGEHWLAMFAFIGGLSAATAMVIVATVALAIMICNDIVVPLILRRRSEEELLAGGRDMSRHLLSIRRMAIFGILLLAYAYYRAAGDTAALVSIGPPVLCGHCPVCAGLHRRAGLAQGNRARCDRRNGWGASPSGSTRCFCPTFAQSGIVSSTILETGPLGLAFFEAAVAFLGCRWIPLFTEPCGAFWSMCCSSWPAP